MMDVFVVKAACQSPQAMEALVDKFSAEAVRTWQCQDPTACHICASTEHGACLQSVLHYLYRNMNVVQTPLIQDVLIGDDAFDNTLVDSTGRTASQMILRAVLKMIDK